MENQCALEEISGRAKALLTLLYVTVIAVPVTSGLVYAVIRPTWIVFAFPLFIGLWVAILGYALAQERGGVKAGYAFPLRRSR